MLINLKLLRLKEEEVARMELVGGRAVILPPGGFMLGWLPGSKDKGSSKRPSLARR